MSIVKRAVILVAAVCMLVGSPAMKASAAACDHKDTGRDLQWTGQYRYSSYTHTVILGYYTNGTPITVQCHVNKTEKIYVTYCQACHEYVGVAYENYKEAHEVVHD